MTTAAQVLAQYGMSNVDPLIRAAAVEGLPLWIAAAFAAKESNGQNIYGHDSGGVFNYGSGTNVAVTSANFADFYNRVVNLHQTSNGVGPMQITWSGFFPDAARKGFKLYDPYDNFRYGFRLIQSYLGGSVSSAAIRSAGTRYNGASVYGDSVAALASTWRTRLAGVTTPTPPPYSPIPNLPSPNLVVDGVFGYHTVRALQSELRNHYRSSGLKGGVPILIDGIWGRNSIASLQRAINYWAKLKGWAQGPIGGTLSRHDISVLQYHVHTSIDGDWGPLTTKAIQTALNNGRF